MSNRPSQEQDRIAGIEEKYSIQIPIKKIVSKHNHDFRT